MQWYCVITSEDLQLPRGTPAQLEDVVRQLPKDLLAAKALQFAGAMGVDSKSGYTNFDGHLLRGAPVPLRDRIAALRRQNPRTTFIFFEP